MTFNLRIFAVGENPTETEHYRLEREATALKQAGDWNGAIEALRKSAVLRGISGGDTRLAKYLQQAGRFDEAMAEIKTLIDDSGAWAKSNFGHQPSNVQHCQRAGWLARIHDDAILLCKREKQSDLLATHEAESKRWWDLHHQLKVLADRDMKQRRQRT